MADDPLSNINDIDDAVKDLSAGLSKIRKDIEKSFKDTSAWSDAAKRLADAQSSAAAAMEKYRDISKQLLKNSSEQARLKLNELASLKNSLEGLKTKNSLTSEAIRLTQIELGRLNQGTVEHVQSQLRLNSLIGTQIELSRDINELDAKKENIEKKILPTLEKNKALLEEQKNLARELYVNEVKRYQAAKLFEITNGEVFQKLVKDSEHFGKLTKLNNAILKGGAESYLNIVGAALDRWIELDSTAGEFRNTTGLLVSQTRELDRAVRETNVEMQQFGVTLTGVYSATKELYGNLQTTALITKDIVSDTARMEANIGVSSAITAKFVSMFGAMSKASTGTATGLVHAAAALADMAGVAPSEVLSDMANASSQTLTFLGRSPMQLMRASVEARRLGTTLENISKSSRGMLDYQSSITDELEASALLGRSISFQESRLLAYQGKVVESRKAALNQIRQIGDFGKLNVYQQEALAKAAGMTVDEVVKQQNQEKMLSAIRASGDKDAIARLDAYESMSKKIAANEKAAQANLKERGDDMVKQQMRQTELNKLTAALSATWVDITDALLPIANSIMPVIITGARVAASIFKVIGAFVRGLLSPFDKFGAAMRSGNEGGMKLEKIIERIGWGVGKVSIVAEGLGKIIGEMASAWLFMLGPIVTILKHGTTLKGIWGDFAKPFAAVSSYFFKMAHSMSSVTRSSGLIARALSPLSKIGASLFRVFGTVAKFAGPIGLLINAIQFLWNLGENLMSVWSDDKMNFGQKIIKSLLAVPDAIFDVLISPFIDIGVWIAKQFGADIPTSMVDGIKSTGKEIFHWLTLPFVKVWDWLQGDGGFLGNSPSGIGLGIVAGLKAVGNSIIDFLVSPFKSAWELIKKIPFVDKMFGGSKDAAAAVASNIQSKIETTANTVVEVKNLDTLQAVVQQLTDAVLKLGTGTNISPTTTTSTNNAGVERKLDELIGLLRGGAIAVNMDGRKVSSAMSTMGT